MKKGLFILILIVFCICFCACECEKNPYIDSGKVYYSEPKEIIIVSSRVVFESKVVEFDSKLVELEYATLVFDSELSIASMNRFVSGCEELLDYLKPEKNSFTTYLLSCILRLTKQYILTELIKPNIVRLLYTLTTTKPLIDRT